MRTAVFALLVVGVFSASLEFEVGPNSCSFDFDGTELSTDCSLGPSFTGSPVASDSDATTLTFAKGGSNCSFDFNDEATTAHCSLFFGHAHRSM